MSELEGPNTAPDRAHNNMLERLAGFGAVGVSLQLLIAGITLAAALTARVYFLEHGFARS